MDFKLGENMKVYKNQNGDTFAYEADGSQDHLISADLIPISEEEEKYLNDIKEKQRFASLSHDEIKNHRHALLLQTDWWATSDRTMTAEQTAYRQALRDVPAQAGFPTSVTWPVEPS